MYEMQIATGDGAVIRCGFHLGTDEAIARELVTERFYGRINANMPTESIALLYKGKIVDYFDGEWANERALY